VVGPGAVWELKVGSWVLLQAERINAHALAVIQTLVERGLCLQQPTDKGNLLSFPSYYGRERPEQVSFPAVLLAQVSQHTGPRRESDPLLRLVLEQDPWLSGAYGLQKLNLTLQRSSETSARVKQRRNQCCASLTSRRVGL
jgi:hypothetical protein